MPNVDLKRIDYAVLECLTRLQHGDAGVLPAELTPCLQAKFPDDAEVEMRQGEAITRLRGRGDIIMDRGARITITTQGRNYVRDRRPEQAD